jgi:hypothetical protein
MPINAPAAARFLTALFMLERLLGNPKSGRLNLKIVFSGVQKS